MEIKLYSRPNKDGKNILYADYLDKGKRVRKSLNLLETKANIAYVYRHIIPEIERKTKYGLEFREYKMTEFTNMVLDHAKETQKLNTFISYRNSINRFYQICGDVNVSEVRAVFIEKYIKALKKQGLSGASINLYLVPIKLALNEAIRLEVIDKNAVSVSRKPTAKNKDKKVFNLMQMHNLLAKAEGELKTFLYIAFFTGARPGEVVELRWTDITDDTITISRTEVRNNKENLPKNGKIRKIALLKPLKEYLDTVKREGNDVFKYTYHYFSEHFPKLVIQCGYERRTLHITRHTFTSLLIKAKEDPTLIQYFLGHASLKMINDVYAHYIEDDMDVSRVGTILAHGII